MSETKELFCPSCEQRTDFFKVNGKWTCGCGYELDDEEQSEEEEDNFTEEMDFC